MTASSHGRSAWNRLGSRARSPPSRRRFPFPLHAGVHAQRRHPRPPDCRYSRCPQSASRGCGRRPANESSRRRLHRQPRAAPTRHGRSRLAGVWYSRPMDREMLNEHLRQAEAQVARADRQVVKQRWTVARLERDGQDTTAARAVLAQLGQARKQHIAERDRLGGSSACSAPLRPVRAAG
jgi:hypothetical protein